MTATKWINFAAGALEGWWLGGGDSRPLEPYVSAERWDQELRSAGFAGIDSLAYDGYLNNNIIAMSLSPTNRQKRVTMLLPTQGAPVDTPVFGLERCLMQSGYHVDRLTLEDVSTCGLPQDQDIVSALDLEGPFFKDLEDHKSRLWDRFVEKLRDGGHGVLWFTRTSRVNNCANPDYGKVIGLARMLRNEANLEFATVEMETLDDPNLECAVNVLKEFHGRFIEESVQPTSEWAIVGGRALIGRYQPIEVARELRLSQDGSTLPDWLEEKLHGAEAQLQPLGPDDVEIAVKAVGVSFEVSNFTMYQARQAPHLVHRQPLRSCSSTLLTRVQDHFLISNPTKKAAVVEDFGFEASGIITQIGTHVPEERLGQRVAFIKSSCLTTRLRMPSAHCIEFPDDLSFEEAASIPAAYSTAIHCMIDRAHARPGMVSFRGNVILTAESHAP